MENFVFPDEIKTKLMKMSKLINILCAMKLCEIAAKLYFFLLTSVSLHNSRLTFRGKNVELLSCKHRHFQRWLVDFHVQNVSSSLSKWFLHTPWTTKWCQTRYLKSRGLYI